MACSSCVEKFREKVLQATPLPRPEEVLKHMNPEHSIHVAMGKTNGPLAEKFIEAHNARTIYVEALAIAAAEHDGPFLQRKEKEEIL